MNFGQNLYLWFLNNAQYLVLFALVGIGIWLVIKREFTKLIPFLIISVIAVGLVFAAPTVKDLFLELFHLILGSSGGEISSGTDVMM